MVCARFLGWENNASSGYLEFRLEKTGELNIIPPHSMTLTVTF